MTRFYGGLGGGGGSSSRFGGSRAGSNSGSSTSSSLEKAMAAKNGQGQKKLSQMTGEERHQALVEKKLSQAKSQLMSDKKFNAFTPPGAKSGERELSKSTQLAMELIAEKMAKREKKLKDKKKKGPVEIKAQGIGGMYSGWISKNGKVTNGSGEVVCTIDPKTGNIKTKGMFGKTIGKYDPKSNYCYFKIQKQLEKHAIQKQKKLDAMNNQASGAWGIYGSSGNDDNNGGGNNGWW